MEAIEIYQNHLDRMSARMWNNDFVGMSEMMYFPHRINLPGHSRVIGSAEEQQLDARAFRESLGALGATAYHRVCREARFADDARRRIVGRHKTYVMRGGSYLTDPYDCEMSLVPGDDGAWLADWITVSVRNTGMAYYHPDNVRGQTPREE